MLLIDFIQVTRVNFHTWLCAVDDGVTYRPGSIIIIIIIIIIIFVHRYICS